jgi:hypothetical protein
VFDMLLEQTDRSAGGSLPRLAARLHAVCHALAVGRRGTLVLACAGVAAIWALLAVAVLRADHAALAFEAAPPAQPARVAAAPFAIGGIGADQNRLVVTIVNTRPEPLRGPFEIRVDGGDPHRVAVDADLPGATTRITLADVGVQRRAPVTVELRAVDGATQTFSAVVAPDQPNDLALASARVDADGVLVVTVANHSPIPLRGNIVIAAREGTGNYALLARREAPLDVAANGTQDVRVGAVGPIDLARARVALSTDAISDANIANDVLRS